jgi:predicted nucleic acid-binding protein
VIRRPRRRAPAISDQGREEIVGALRQYFAGVDAKRQPVSAREADDIIDEAMRNSHVSDVVVVQTALIGGAEVICTNDEDFYDPGLTRFLTRVGVSVMDDVTLVLRMRK